MNFIEHNLIPLERGAVAPDFTLPWTHRQTLSLQRLVGRPIILVFYPSAHEPVSREQLTLYQTFLPQFEEFKAQVVGIAADLPACHEAFAEQTGVRFPLLSDSRPRGAVSRLYGVYREGEEMTGRALFVVDPSGVIHFSAAYADSLNPGVGDLLTVLEAMRAEEDTQR
jgi:peroxiredoxin